MTYIVDRRLNAKNKSTVNRQRFLDRHKKHIKKAVSDAVSNRSITDMERGEKISIPDADLNEPHFAHGQGGDRQYVHPGNQDFVAGDRIARPKGGGGGGQGGQASDQGEGLDEFVFQINQDEFVEYLFDDLELPNMVKRQLTGSDSFTFHRAGVSNVGNPNQLDVVRSLRSASARRIALGRSKRKRLRELEQALLALCPDMTLEAAMALVEPEPEVRELQEQIEQLRKKLGAIPFIDDFDLKYNLHVKHPVPTSQAVMFCLMDVSGSMDQATKDIAKRFFILLYMFLKRNYERIEIVFVRHHTSAREVDEQDFFYSRETGCTIVSSALKLTNEIIDERFPLQDWNIYAAQASDGDNWNDDSDVCYQQLTEILLPKLQHYSYIEITPRDHQALWRAYERVLEEFPESFAMRQIGDASDIFPVFRELFQRQEA